MPTRERFNGLGSSGTEDKAASLEPPSSYWPLDNSTLHLNDGQSLEVGEPIFQRSRTSGRGTSVFRGMAGLKNVVVKCSYRPSTSRTNEAQIVKSATDFARASGDSWVIRHLPAILHGEERELGSKCHPSGNSGQEYTESGVLRIVVQEELHRITELTTAAELGEAFRGIFRCYRWLYEKAHIVHRDISLSNLMFRTVNGKIYGVLNDFDLSVDMNAEPRFPSDSEQRPGTLPYMALELLAPRPPPPRHFYRFDLESLFYAMLIASCHYHDGKKIEDRPFEEWQHLAPTALCYRKNSFLNLGPVPAPTSNFANFDDLNWDLRAMFREGFHAQAKDDYMRRQFAHKSNFDQETFGGLVTFDTFEQILDQHLAPLT
ncbi:Other 1 protein kinase [Mycena sanguinolenta]|uniref:Other 1 protein kinase n=1 Tax=Mycena sanguinolenta TaxID=230812 RepID=A0A8H6XFV5_9AGAR|nr:Other 1 protein kinase [Mycena sanguinolenta]